MSRVRMRLAAMAVIGGLTMAFTPTQAASPASRPDSVASRVYGKWVSGRINGGGFVQNVVETADPARVYAYVDMAGVYRSDDGGWSWRNMSAGLPPSNNGYDIRGLSVDPANPDHLIICHGSMTWGPRGISRSTDGGATWTLVHPAFFSGNNGLNRTTGSVIARSPTDPNLLVAVGHGDGIHVSRDGGVTWTATPKRHEFTDVRFDLTNPSRLFASATPYKGRLFGEEQPVDLPGGVWISEDAGATWTQQSDIGISEMTQSINEPNRLFGIIGFTEVHESNDLGATWTDRNDGLVIKPGTDGGGPTSAFRYRSLASGPGFVLLGNTAGDVFRLNDGESSWTRITPDSIDPAGWWGQMPGPYLRFGKAASALVVSRFDPDRWYMTDWYAIWRTEDAGKTWAPAVEGYEPTVIHLIHGAPDQPGVVHLMMADNGHFVSRDNGMNFGRGGKGLTSQMRAVVACRAVGQRMYAAGKGQGTAGNWVSNSVYRSDDGGANWTSAMGSGLPDTDNRKLWLTSVSVDPVDPDFVAVTISGQVGSDHGGPYLSRDGGKTWSWIGQGLPEQDKFFHDTFWQRNREIVVAPGGKLYAISAHSPAVWGWEASWGQWRKLTDLPAGAFGLAVDPQSSGVVVSVPGHGVWLSEDAGTTWAHVHKGDTASIAWDDINPQRIAVASLDDNSAMLMSRDRGRTWQALDQSLPLRHGMRPTFAHGRLFVGTSGGGIFFYDE
jgi:photosystem II stability/assembly factor-like uncharacterized protein